MSTEPSVTVSRPDQQHESLTPEIIEGINLDAEREISKVLQVPEIDNQSVVSSEGSIEIKKKETFVPGTVKTRAALIRKIQEMSDITGNQGEIKAMRLHRRRRNSLDLILREQFTKAVTEEATKRMGIPPAEDVEGRISYAVDALYRFDLCCCKLIEKGIDFLDVGATCSGLSETIDNDPRIRTEIKKSFRDWLIENGNMEWVETAASPSVRILLCHLYPLVSVLRQKPPDYKNQEISPTVKMGLAKAHLRNAIDPPRPRPMLPNGMKLV